MNITANITFSMINDFVEIFGVQANIRTEGISVNLTSLFDMGANVRL